MWLKETRFLCLPAWFLCQKVVSSILKIELCTSACNYLLILLFFIDLVIRKRLKRDICLLNELKPSLLLTRNKQNGSVVRFDNDISGARHVFTSMHLASVMILGVVTWNREKLPLCSNKRYHVTYVQRHFGYYGLSVDRSLSLQVTFCTCLHVVQEWLETNKTFCLKILASTVAQSEYPQ